MKITTFLLTISLMYGASTAFSQTQSLASPTQEQTEEISSQELEKFAEAYVEVQEETQKMQGEAIEIIEKEGLDIDRFNEIANAQNNPNAAVEVKEEEQEKINSIQIKIQEMQVNFQEKAIAMIESKGLTIQRYQEVYQALQQDADLQEKFNALING